MTVATSDRHRRQKLLPWLDEAGQERLYGATVLIARVGGLGGPLTQSLAMAGVGRIIFFHDGELLDEDLHRMVLMHPDGVGRPRAAQAEASLRKLGRPGIEVRGIDARIRPEDAARWMREADLAIGAAPTYEERLILNDAAIAAGKPFVDAAMYDDEATLLCVHPDDGACLRCLVPDPPEWRADFPVLAAVSAAIGSLAAYQCVRILARSEPVPWGEWIHLDVERMAMKKTRLQKRPGCPSCGQRGRAK
jgi:molybdopterin/thiamine biosynthesis adenylyltransferase